MPASPSTATLDADTTNWMTRVRAMRAAYWPDDCPDCATRMEFVLIPDTPTHRRCPACARTVTAAEVLR